MVNVISLGYIGLPTALMMTSHGVEVVGTNPSQGKVDMLRSGHTTFKEDGLDELFQAALDGGIKFITEYQVADVYIVSVQTPYDEFTKKVDMSYVNTAIGDILKVAPKGQSWSWSLPSVREVLIKYVRPYVEEKGFKIGEDIHLVHAPERIIPGNMMYGLLHNDHTIGTDDPAIGEKIRNSMPLSAVDRSLSPILRRLR